MSRWGNSRELTRSSYDLVRQNPGMNRWAVRAAVHGAVVGGIGTLIGLGLVVAGGVALDGSGSGAVGIAAIAFGVLVVIAATVAGLAAANLQLAALVSAADDILHDRPLDEDAARAAAHSSFRTIFEWSAISVVVGGLVSLIRGNGDSGMVVTIVRTLLAGLVAAVWSVVTTLVMPVIILEHVGAVPAIKRSAGIIRTTWGESVFGSVRIGARFGLMFALPGVLLLAGGLGLGIAVGGGAPIAAGAVLALVGVALIVIGAVKAATCRNVFGVALYRWATGEGALGPFTDADLRGAVRTREVPVSAPASSGMASAA